MGLLKEFKEFALKGNVLDMAVGIIIGAEFGKIVNSLVNDVLMPPLGSVMGKVQFQDKFVSLDGKEYDTLEIAKKASAPVLGYGQFLTVVINFVIVALCVFVAIKAINMLRKKQAAEPTVSAAPPKTEVLLEEIRDLLKNKAA